MKSQPNPIFKMGDKVIYKGEKWEVGFVNQMRFEGSLRLQKSGLSDAKQVNYIWPEAVRVDDN